MAKKIYLIVLVLLATISMKGADPNTLSISNVTTIANAKGVVLTVSLSNKQAITDVQFDLTLPNGVSIDTDDSGNPRITLNTSRTTSDNHSISCKQQTDGSTRILCVSDNGSSFSGTSGAIINIYLNTSGSMSAGNYNASLNNIVLSNSSNIYKPSKATGTITIQQTAKLTLYLDGELYSQETKIVGSAISVPSLPAKEGYTFSGWGDVPSTMPATDLTLNASYTINKYTVTYMVDGEEYQKDTLDYGATIVLPKSPEKFCHIFNGWGEVPTTMPAKNLIFEANFTANHPEGDVNLDGKVNSADVVSIYNYIINGTDSNILKANADVNADNDVNGADVTAVYNIIIGK